MRAKWLVVFVLFGTSLSAQIAHPKASAFSKITQEVGLTSVSVAYSRPSAQGRIIFGDLVPYGRIWRVGANESTKLTVDSEITVLGNTLPKGTYALYAFPYKEKWEIVFHYNTGHWGDGRKNYNPEEDVFRITVLPEKTEAYHETFLISFENVHHNGMEMTLNWAHTKIVVPMTVATHAKMLVQIETAITEKPTAETYYQAARYLQEQDVDHERALGYVNTALQLEGDTYYFYRVRSLLQAAMHDYEAAISSAKESLALAEKEGKDEFVRMNQKNIFRWRRQLQKEPK
ncbi:DUF2911 domain-containing protein [Maribacter sp. 2-571]|uniref:DUF2911 domain-containing protein n=1 Tax=Maribacter sp. 2-571 TaxID=3417569 RepID=UPI003D330F39